MPLALNLWIHKSKRKNKLRWKKYGEECAKVYMDHKKERTVWNHLVKREKKEENWGCRRI